MGGDSPLNSTAARATAWRLFAGSLLNEGAVGFFFTLWPLYIASLGASPPEIGLVIGISGILRLLFLLPLRTDTRRVIVKPIAEGTARVVEATARACLPELISAANPQG